MEQNRQARVTVIASTAEVGSFLRNCDFALARTDGIAISEPSGGEDALGILRPQKPNYIELHRWFGLLRHRKRVRREFLATLWFSNRPRGAHEGRWVLEVNHSRFLKEMTELAEALSAAFITHVEVYVGNLGIDCETFRSDGSF